MSDDYFEPREGGQKRGLTDTATPADGQPAELPLDAVFELLADERRRYILNRLEECDGVAQFETLVDCIASREADDPEQVDREAITVDLHHRTLPRLADSGVLEYDSRSETVRYWGHPLVEIYATGTPAESEQ